MKTWLDSLLYTVGMPFKGEYLSSDPSLIVDLRKKTETSHWYVGKVNGCEYVSIEMETGSAYKDSGRIKDKDTTVKRICEKIVDYLGRKQLVIIICYDGMGTSGYIAMVCKWWIRYQQKEIERDFDCVNEVRDAGDFNSARSKDQREQMERVKEEAVKILGWEKCNFKKKIKLTTK